MTSTAETDPENKTSSVELPKSNLLPKATVPTEEGAKKVEDLEVKDAQLIFHSVWHELEQEVGVENLHFPAEIFCLICELALKWCCL